MEFWKRLGAHLHANFVAYIALFVALSAGAYAAGLKPNSVKSKHIKDGQVQDVDVADSVATQDELDLASTDLLDLMAAGQPLGAQLKAPRVCSTENCADSCLSASESLDQENRVISFAETDFDDGFRHLACDIEDTLQPSLYDGFTVPEDGLYLIVGNITLSDSAVGGRKLTLLFGNSNQEMQVTEVGANPDDGKFTSLGVTHIADLSGGDLIRIRINQNSGGNLNLARGDLSMVRLARG